jgi:hypothetical protein
MELEPADEMVVSENLEVFKASGFELTVDDEAPPGQVFSSQLFSFCAHSELSFADHKDFFPQRVRLIAVPFSKGTVFGPSDVHEMICLCELHALPLSLSLSL